MTHLTSTTTITTAPTSGERPEDMAVIKRLQAVIWAENDRLEQKYPILTKRNWIEGSLCIGACVGMVLMSALYLTGVVPWWLTILVNGWFAALLNEIEHDLMHFIVFKKSGALHFLMMILVWAFRGNYMNPWNRRKVHLLHHKVSGSKRDVETRMIGLGMHWTLLRVLLMVDTFWVVVIRKRIERDAAGSFDFKDTARNMIPFTWLFFLLWLSLLSFTAFHVLDWALSLRIPVTGFAASYEAFLHNAWVVYLAPAMLRTAASHISSNANHYHGENLGLLQQTQSVDVWYLRLLQPYCFNFAATHTIHHLVVQQPFYMRQLVAKAVYAPLREAGIAFNDFDTWRRRNAPPTAAMIERAEVAS